MGVKLVSSSGGSVEIAAPTTASNYTLTAPASTATIDTLSRTGNVLQVVNVTYSTQVDSSSATFSDTGLTATITPTSATSKILVLVSQNNCYKPSYDTSIFLKLQRNSSNILAFGTYVSGTGSTIQNVTSVSASYLDSPASISALTYKTVFVNVNGLGSCSVQFGGGASTITLMEIAG